MNPAHVVYLPSPFAITESRTATPCVTRRGLGTPLDVGRQELRIKCFSRADEATRTPVTVWLTNLSSIWMVHNALDS
jgi:hypothetical protein